MAFAPVFQILGKFTQGVAAQQIYGAPSWQEIRDVSDYLGVILSENDLSSAIEKLTNELTEQNRFLTENLFSCDVESSELYRRSLFVREIVTNNRNGRKD